MPFQKHPFLAFLQALLIVLLGALANPVSGTEVYVVVNPSVDQDTIRRGNVRAIVSMRRTLWDGGDPIQVFVLPEESPIHQAFCKETLHIFPYQLADTWERLVFSGTGRAPTRLDTPAEMKRRIANTPGAIGYLPGDYIDESVEVVIIQ